MLYLKNDRFRRFYIAVYHNDNDYSEYHSSHILLSRSHLSLSTTTTIVSVQWKDRLRLFVAKKYEMCRVSSLIVTNLVDKHLSSSFLSYMIRFTYDSVFSMIVQFWCSLWTIISCLQLCIQTRMFFFDQRIVSDFLAHSLTSFLSRMLQQW